MLDKSDKIDLMMEFRKEEVVSIIRYLIPSLLGERHFDFGSLGGLKHGNGLRP